MLLCSTSINAVQHNPTEVIYASSKDITHCLATNLYQKNGYTMDMDGVDIHGINKEFTVHYPNSSRIAGIFWITKSIFGSKERTVGMYNVNDRLLPDFVQALHQCAKRLSEESHL